MLALIGVLQAPGVAGARSKGSSSDARLRALENELRKTQDELKSLKGRVEQQRAVGQATEKETQEATETANKASEASKKVASLPDWLSKVSVTGDVRYRHEGFYNQPHVQTSSATARNRERVRARLGVKYTYSDELSATIRGATGNPNDPISTNETLSGAFNRKNFNLDLAFITFTPGKSFGIRPGVASISAGKIQKPLFRTDELVFDEDVAPEGLSQTFQLLDKPVGALDQVKVHALEWTYAEIANKQDGWMFGGQINPTAHVGTVQLEGGLGQYYWLNPDLIAQALSRNTTAFTASGSPVANGSFNSTLANTNLLNTVTVQPPTVKGGKKPAAFTSILGYKSGFNQTNAVLAATIPNVVANQPLKLFADYVYNWDAATDDAHGWLTGLKLGQTKAAGDWAIYGAYEHLGQEATISSFTSSEFGTAGTNVKGPSIGIDYQVLNPLTISARGYFTNFINRPANTTNQTLNRVQLDALVRF